MSSLITELLVVACCVATIIQAVTISPCSEGPTPINVRVDGCDTNTCTYEVGTHQTLTMDFKPVSPMNALYATIVLKDDQNDLKYNIGNTLRSTNPQCTQIDQDTLRFQYSSIIQPPLGNFASTIYLTDDANVTQACFQYNANVVDS